MEIRSPACKAPLTGKLCEDPSCPACRKAKSLFRVKELLRSEDFFGSAPGVFVGHYGYPHLNVGILSPPERTERAWLYDAPRHWALSNMQIPEIIDCRTSLINSRFKAQVKDANKFLIMGQEVAMASKPVDVEINLEKKPRFSFQTDAVISPMGPNAALKDAKITENPKISGKVDKVVSGTDWKAGEAITYLFSNEFDENFLSRLLSIGNVGLKHSRRLVPTRWAITATDDVLAKHLIKEIKDFPSMDYTAFSGGYLGNHYLILCFPEVYSYELFEMYASPLNPEAPSMMSDYEPYDGRKSYAEETAGGFYAARLAIAEKLKEIKRQASVLALRFITEAYEVPLGVFVVREAARKAMQNRPITFSSLELMETYAKHYISRKFNISFDAILRESQLLAQIKHQQKLSDFG